MSFCMRRFLTLRLCRGVCCIAILYSVFVVCAYVRQPLEQDNPEPFKLSPVQTSRKNYKTGNQFKKEVEPRVSRVSFHAVNSQEKQHGKVDTGANNTMENRRHEPVDEDQAKVQKMMSESFHEVEKEMQVRRQRVKEVCHKYGLGEGKRKGPKTLRYPPSANYGVLYIDRPDGLTWCPVYKAASTTWLNIMCRLAGVKESTLVKSKEQVSHVARRLWPELDYEDALQAIPQTVKFMIVRHPFERIVSAYRDKLENTNTGIENGVLHYYQKYGKKIVQKYRHSSSDSNFTHIPIVQNPSLPAPKGIEPTFREFVRYLIDTDLVLYSDDHWIPYYLFCTPCYIHYDVIAKFESLEKDQQYLLHLLHLEEKVTPKWKHLTKGVKTSDVVKKYLQSLTKDEIKLLAEKYKVDFEMYGYSYSDYL